MDAQHSSRRRRGPPRWPLRRIAGFEVLVHLEEVLHLEPVELRHVVDVAQMLQTGSATGTQMSLSSPAGLVGHAEHADRAAPDEAAGERRFCDEDQVVQRIAILTEGVVHESVVVGTGWT